MFADGQAWQEEIPSSLYIRALLAVYCEASGMTITMDR
jgi:hypothetical protein